MQIYDYSSVDFNSFSSVQDAVNLSLARGEVLDEGFYNQAANSLSARVPENSIHLFGSGGTAAETLGNLGREGSQYSHIQTSDAGKLFASDEFLAALRATYEANLTVNGFASPGEALNGGNVNSLFGTVSLRYAENVSGDVFAIVRDADPLRIFSQVELQALLENEAVTSINGIPKEDLLRFGSSSVLNVFDLVQESSDEATSFLLSDAFINGRVGGVSSLEGYFAEAGISTDGNFYFDAAVETDAVARQYGIPIQDFSGVPRVLRALDAAGTAGDLAEVAVTTYLAVSLFSEGRNDEANELLTDAAVSFGAGAIATAIFLTVVPEPTSTAAGLAFLAGAFAAGAAGEQFGTAVLENVRAHLANRGTLSDRDLINILTSTEGNCFVAGTEISVWPREYVTEFEESNSVDGDKRKTFQVPIEKIAPGDVVVSFDAIGNLVPRKVTRTFRKEVKTILDFFGTGVTPGHVYYRSDSKKSYKFETLIDVLRDDGVIQNVEGVDIRAATGLPTSDARDGFVWAVTGQLSEGSGSVAVVEQARIRRGTRIITDDGRDLCVEDLIVAGGGTVNEDGFVCIGDQLMPFHWIFGDALPKPEDYVLQRSGTTLEEIYKASEWEAQRPHMPVPMARDGGPVQPLSQAGLSAMAANAPKAFEAGATPTGPVLNRKHRKAAEANLRKFTKPKKTVH